MNCAALGPVALLRLYVFIVRKRINPEIFLSDYIRQKPLSSILTANITLIFPLVCSHGRISRENVCFGNCVDSSGNLGHHTTVLGSARQESSSIMGRLSDGSCIGIVSCYFLILEW